MKKSIAAFALLASLASAPSSASVYNAGVLGPAHWNGAGTIGYAPATAFTDYFNFTLVSPYNTVGGGVNSFSGSLPGVGTIGATYNPVTLHSGTYSSGSPAAALATYSTPFSFNSAPLAAGNYFVRISGTITGSVGGAYIPSLNATISTNTITTPPAAVPEPETWVMLALGAALMGFQARRKPEADAMDFAV